MILQGDSLEILKTLESESVHCCVTSPPYWGLRDYGVNGQIGVESSMYTFVCKLTEVFREVKRVLRPDGTLWLNLGDSYAGGMSRGAVDFSEMQSSNKGALFAKGKGPKIPDGLKHKDLCGVPWRVAFALQDDGWFLRSDIIWHKPNPMPESVADRPTKSHEYLFLLSKSKDYYYDNDAIREPFTETSIARLSQDIENQEGSDRAHAGAKTNGKMKAVGGSFHNHADDLTKGNRIANKGVETYHPMGRNKRTVWTVSTQPFKDAHFATFPTKLIEPCILAGCPRGGTVLDPFFGSGTTGLVAVQNGREYLGIELNPEYIAIAKKRFENTDTTATMFDMGAYAGL